jgi:hypothetical protein
MVVVRTLRASPCGSRYITVGLAQKLSTWETAS